MIRHCLSTFGFKTGTPQSTHDWSLDAHRILACFDWHSDEGMRDCPISYHIKFVDIPNVPGCCGFPRLYLQIQVHRNLFQRNSPNMTQVSISLRPPCCSNCNCFGERQITRRSNRNGNAGRPYFRCPSCSRFLTFDDDRGIHPTNENCHCGAASRRQLNGRDHAIPGGIHYVCARGKCKYFSRHMTNYGWQLAIEEELVNLLIKTKLF